MAANEQHEAHGAARSGPMGGTVRLLERLDNWAHVIVAAFFILMATTVIVHMGFIFLRQLPLIVPAATVETTPQNAPVAASSQEGHNKPDGEPAKNHADSTSEKAPAGKTGENKAEEHSVGGMAAHPAAVVDNAKKNMAETSGEAAHSEPADPFVKNSLELLSNILFVVILLELLRTIITYLETHDIQAIMQEFLVVGIISSVRKILLVGAEASLRQGAPQSEFIMEASGVVIDILGILLLILGLVMLKRAFGSKTLKEPQEK